MKSEVVCKPFTFKVAGKSYSSLMNRYKLGKAVDGRLVLDPYECSFLLITGRILPEGQKTPEQIIQHFENSEDFAYVFNVYFALKKAGFYAKVTGRDIDIKKRPSDQPVTVLAGRDDQSISFCSGQNESEHISAIVDMDGDITIFGISEIDIQGNVDILKLRSQVSVTTNRILEGAGEFPSWLGYSRGKMRFLSEIEFREIRDSSTGLVEDNRIKVYSDLSKRGLILKSGFKYGADFRAYRNMESEHAEYLINSVGDPIEWPRLSRLVRVANAVRKMAVLACPMKNRIKYIQIRRIKDFNSLYSDQIWASKSSTVDLNSE